MGRKAKKPSKQDLKEIEMLAGLGLTQKQIADIKDICLDTLRKYAYRSWEKGKAKGIGKVARIAFEMAVSGKDGKMTRFYLRTQAGWRDKHLLPEELKHLIVGDGTHEN